MLCQYTSRCNRREILQPQKGLLTEGVTMVVWLHYAIRRRESDNFQRLRILYSNPGAPGIQESHEERLSLECLRKALLI